MFVVFCRALIVFSAVGFICVALALYDKDFNANKIRKFFFYDGYSPPVVHVGEKRRDEHKKLDRNSALLRSRTH